MLKMNNSTELPQAKTSEVSVLLNPAFCAEILCRFIDGYDKNNGVDFLILFFVLPIVTHPKTEEIMSLHPKTKLLEMLKEYPEIKFNIKERIENFMPITRSALIFAIAHKAIEFDEAGKCKLIPKYQKKGGKFNGYKTKEYFDLSSRFGKKCSIYYSATMFYLLGISP